MHPKVFDYSQRNSLFRAGERVVVGVSGGADSVAALRVLHELSSFFEISLSVAHLNHGFRGAAAQKDADFVRALCLSLDIPYYGDYVDVPGILASYGGSPQQVAREHRFSFFKTVAVETGASTVALGHHKDDQAETILLHMLRGSGPGGMEGMRPRAGYQGLHVVRPLLCVDRKEILAYLEGLGQSYCVDASNFKEDYTRNYVRLRVLPALREVNPGVTDMLCRLGGLVAEDNEELCRQVEEMWSSVCHADEEGIHIRVDDLCSMPNALSRRVIRRAWQEIHQGLTDLEYVHVEAVMGLLSMQVGRTVSLPKETMALRQRHLVSIFKKVAFMPYDYPLVIPGETALPGNMVIKAESIIGAQLHYQQQDPYTAYVQIPSGRLGVRSRVPGDRYQPVGFRGRRKVKDMMSEAQIPRHLRDMWPVVVHDGAIVWVPGGRVGEDHKISNEPGMVVKLSLLRGGNAVECRTFGNTNS